MLDQIASHIADPNDPLVDTSDEDSRANHREASSARSHRLLRTSRSRTKGHRARRERTPRRRSRAGSTSRPSARATCGNLAKLDSLGHAVTIGTRDVAATLTRETKDSFGNPPYRTWAAAHPRVVLESFATAAARGEVVINALTGADALSGPRSPERPTSRTRSCSTCRTHSTSRRAYRRRSQCRTPTRSTSRSSARSRRRAW